MLGITDIKTGRKILLEGDPYVVLWNEHSKVGRAGAVMRTKLKNLATGAVIEKTFQGSERVEEADISKSPAQFLYAEGTTEYHFMNNDTYEQFSLSEAALGDTRLYLLEGGEVTVLLSGDTAINVDIPAKVTLRVTEAPPGLKGDTQSGGDKRVTTETGLTVTTPLFINVDDRIIINTEKGTYVSRAD